MPLQNRVTPFGEILAMPQRGTFTGNRGIIHDPATKTLLRRRWTTKAWITCRLHFKNVRRDVMARRSWTELFFLDEATALAAGHRPCFYCRRDAAEAFRTAWAKGHGCALPSAPQMDTTLHLQRLQLRAGCMHALTDRIAALPDGAMIAAAGQAFVVLAGRPLLWQPGGYWPSGAAINVDGLITPPATMAALQAGYRPVLHASAAAALQALD